MDYSKLTHAEIISAAKYHGFTIQNWLQQFQTIKVIPGAPIAVELIDLYIAQQLYNLGIEIPNDLNMNNITPEYYQQLAPVLYLPTEYTDDNLIRARRIIRIIQDLIAERTVTLVTTPEPNKITIMPVIFTKPRKIGDFSWMLQQPEYNDVLFLFNDNESQFLDFEHFRTSGIKNQGACSMGGGNAIIRPYQCRNPPRAAGIPTGDNRGGYQNLNRALPYINRSIDYIKTLLQTGKYQRVAYSADADGYNLGTSIFNPSEDIKRYIVEQIWSLVK